MFYVFLVRASSGPLFSSSEEYFLVNKANEHILLPYNPFKKTNCACAHLWCGLMLCRVENICSLIFYQLHYKLFILFWFIKKYSYNPHFTYFMKYCWYKKSQGYLEKYEQRIVMLNINNNATSVTLKEKSSVGNTKISEGMFSWLFEHNLWLSMSLFYLEICRRLLSMDQVFQFWNFGTKLLQLQFFILDFRL